MANDNEVLGIPVSWVTVSFDPATARREHFAKWFMQVHGGAWERLHPDLTIDIVLNLYAAAFEAHDALGLCRSYERGFESGHRFSYQVGDVVCAAGADDG